MIDQGSSAHKKLDPNIYRKIVVWIVEVDPLIRSSFRMARSRPIFDDNYHNKLHAYTSLYTVVCMYVFIDRKYHHMVILHACRDLKILNMQ